MNLKMIISVFLILCLLLAACGTNDDRITEVNPGNAVRGTFRTITTLLES